MKKVIPVVLLVFCMSGCANVTPINDGSGYDTYMITVGGYNSPNDLIEKANELCGEKGFTPLSLSQSGQDVTYTMYGPVLSSQKTLIVRCNEKKVVTEESKNK